MGEVGRVQIDELEKAGPEGGVGADRRPRNQRGRIEQFGRRLDHVAEDRGLAGEPREGRFVDLPGR